MYERLFKSSKINAGCVQLRKGVVCLCIYPSAPLSSKCPLCRAADQRGGKILQKHCRSFGLCISVVLGAFVGSVWHEVKFSLRPSIASHFCCPGRFGFSLFLLFPGCASPARRSLQLTPSPGQYHSRGLSVWDFSFFCLSC